MGPLSECVSLCCYSRLSLFTAISQPSSRQLTPGGPATQTLTLMSRGWRTGAGGAAQPTLTPGGAAQPAFFALPQDASELTVAFYNVGIKLSQVGTKKWENNTEKQLAADIVKAANEHALDILCLSELGELGKGIGTKLPEGNVIAWIRRLLADSAASPVHIYADEHYATLVLSDRVEVLEYRVIRDFVQTQRDRCFQHFRVRTSDRDEPISIVNCHAPSSKKRKLRVDMRRRYFAAFHEACAGSPFIWGGDFNTGLIQLMTFLAGIDDRYTQDSSAAQPGSLQTVFSHPLKFKHGDLAVTFGLCSVQVNSEIGFSFNGTSDAHDVVVAKVFGNARSAAQPARQENAGNEGTPPPQQSSALTGAERPELPMPTRPAPRPKAEASSASSAAQPAQQEPAGSALPQRQEQSSALTGADRPEWPMPTRPAPRPEAEASAASSAAQPAQQEPAGSALPPRHRRVNAVFGTDDPSMAPLQEVLEQIGSQFLFGKVANIVASSTGCYELATVPCIVEKLEAFLEIVEEQRSRHQRRHQSLTSDDVFSHEDMQEIHREWMEDHESWMNGETLNKYNCRLQGTGKGDHQKAHQIRRSAFSAFVFQIIGNKHVALASIQHPICSAAQPADAIQRFMRAWEEEKSSEDYKKRVQISEQLTKERMALKNAAHASRQAFVRGRKIHAAILQDSNQRAALSDRDKTLLDDFTCGTLERVRDNCDAAFGWNNEMRAAASSTANKIGR